MKLTAIGRAAAPLGSAGPPAFIRSYTLRDFLTMVLYHRRIMLAAFVVPVLLGFAAASMSKPAYVAQARLLVLYGSEYFYHPSAGGQSNYSVALDRDEIIEGELQVLKSTTLAIETLQKLGIDKVYPGMPAGDPMALQRAARRMGSDLSLSSIPQSNILELSYRNTNPEVASEVLRTLIALYLQRREAIFERPPTPNAESDRDAFLGRIHAAEDALSRFAQQHGIADLDQQMNLLLQQQSANSQAVDATAQAIAETSAKLTSIKAQLQKMAPMVQAFADNDRSQRTQALTDDLVKLQVKRTGLATRYDSNYPAIQDLDRQIAAIQAQIASEPSRESALARSSINPIYQDAQGQEIALEAALSGLQAKAASLATAATRLDTQIRDLTQSAIQYRDLKRNRDVLDEAYRAFVRSTEETQMAYEAERSKATNVRVVQPPEAGPAALNMRMVLPAAGIVLGLVAAVAAMLVANAFRQVFITVRDVNLALELPVLVAVKRGRRVPARRGAPKPQSPQVGSAVAGMIDA
jgi:uncharacterized protein involved in exopolysaccharide biosynthesis